MDIDENIRRYIQNLDKNNKKVVKTQDPGFSPELAAQLMSSSQPLEQSLPQDIPVQEKTVAPAQIPERAPDPYNETIAGEGIGENILNRLAAGMITFGGGNGTRALEMKRAGKLARANAKSRSMSGSNQSAIERTLASQLLGTDIPDSFSAHDLEGSQNLISDLSRIRAMAARRSGNVGLKMKPLHNTKEDSLDSIDVLTNSIDQILPLVKAGKTGITPGITGKLKRRFVSNPEYRTLKSMLDEVTLKYAKANEKGVLSDFDKRSYKALVGDEWDTPEDLHNILTKLRSNSVRNAKVLLDNAKRNNKDVSKWEGKYNDNSSDSDNGWSIK